MGNTTKIKTKYMEMEYDFSALPPHVLTNILSQLPLSDIKNASQSCRAWYYASFDSKIVDKILLNFTTEPTDSMDIFVRPITKIRFESINFEKFDYKQILRNFGHKITEFHLYFCVQLRINQLFEMFIYLSNLKVLRLEYGARYYKPDNFYKHGRITKHKDKIMQNLARVQELHIRTTEQNLIGAEILLNYCTNLKTLHWNENNFHEKSDNFAHNILVNRINNCTSNCLENLTVHSIDRDENSKFFEHLFNLDRTNLRSLNLKEISETYYDDMFKEFCKTYKSLEKLTMDGCNDRQLADICENMRNLKMLNLDKVTACNLNYVWYLTKLENFTLRRTFGVTDESLIELFRLKPKNITELTLNYITSVLLKEICENLPHLKRLRLELINTKECAPIFQNLTELKQIHLEFEELSKINSDKIESDPVWNVTKLVELEDLFVNTFLPGFTPDLIRQLPKLRTKHHEYVYDIPENETDDVDKDDCDQNEDESSENNDYEEVDDVGATEQVEWCENQNEKEENREYDLMEFNFLFHLLQRTNSKTTK